MSFTERTLEYFRAVGIEARIPQANANARLRRGCFESLSSEPLSKTPWTGCTAAPAIVARSTDARGGTGGSSPELR